MNEMDDLYVVYGKGKNMEHIRTIKNDFEREFIECGVRDVIRYGKILIDGETKDNTRHRMIYYRECLWFTVYHNGQLVDWYVFEHKEPKVSYENDTIYEFDNDLPFN